MRYHLLNSTGNVVAEAEGLLTEGVTFTVLPPAEGEDPLIISRVAIEDPTGEMQDAIEQHLNLPLTVESPLTLTVTLNLATGA
jgi:hypothetical protein